MKLRTSRRELESQKPEDELVATQLRRMYAVPVPPIALGPLPEHADGGLGGRVRTRRALIVGASGIAAAVALGILSPAGSSIRGQSSGRVSAAGLLKQAAAREGSPDAYHRVILQRRYVGITTPLTFRTWVRDQQHFREDVESVDPVSGRDQTASLIRNGDIVWSVYTRGDGTVQAVFGSPGELSIIVGVGGPFEVTATSLSTVLRDLEQGCAKATLRGEEIVLGRKAHLIDVANNSSEMCSFGHTVLWLDAESLLTLKAETLSQDGQVQWDFVVTEFEYRPSIGDEVFDYQPPASATVYPADAAPPSPPLGGSE